MPNSAQLRAQRLDLRAGDGVFDAEQRVGRSVVVFRRDREIGPADLATGEPQAVERLWTGHLVHEVEVDVEKIGFPGARN